MHYLLFILLFLTACSSSEEKLKEQNPEGSFAKLNVLHDLDS